MIWAGSPFAQRIEFSTGLPIGAVSYSLIGNAGGILHNQDVIPAAGDVSMQIIIPGSLNSCATPLFEHRTLVYTYITADGVVSDRIVYRVLRPIPFAASPEGVRSKLGIEPHELTDADIDLVSAYAEILTYGDPVFYVASGDRNTLLIIHAIEALAALIILPTLQLKLAQGETSATSEFKRYANVDWSRIEAELMAHLHRARALLDPDFDTTGGAVFSFGVAGRSLDNVTGVGPV